MTKNTLLNRPRRKGFSLVEVLLALAVLGIAILSIVGLLNATFESVSKNLSTSQALNVYTYIDSALEDASNFVDIDGRQIVSRNAEKPSFDYVYDWVRDKKGANWDDAVFFVVVSQRLNPENDAAPQRVMRAIKATNSTALPTKAQLDNLNAEGNVYLVRAFISPQLHGRHTEMTASGEVTAATYSAGSSLPASPDTYALPYIPLTLEIYAFAVGATSQDETQLPILSQILIFQR